jgi:hypothetical protein
VNTSIRLRLKPESKWLGSYFYVLKRVYPKVSGLSHNEISNNNKH